MNKRNYKVQTNIIQICQEDLFMKINRKIKNLTIIALGVMLLNIFVGAYTNKLPEKILVNT